MNGRWLRVGVLLALSAMILVRAAPAIATYTGSGSFNVIGMPMAWEENNAGKFQVTAQYSPGLAYRPPSKYYGSTVSNIIHFNLNSPQELNNAPLKNYTIYLWYSYRQNSYEIPQYNLLQLPNSIPQGPVDTGLVYSYSVSYTVSSSVSFGTDELGLEAGQSVGMSYGFSEPARIYVRVDQNPYQKVYTAAEINKLESKMIHVDKKNVNTTGSHPIYLESDNNWKLRYLGKITVTPYTDKVPTYMDLAAVLAADNWAANYTDNYLYDGAYIVAVVVAHYYKKDTHWVITDWNWIIPLPHRVTVIHKPVNMITFIFGDNGQKVGDDCYMWFYKVN